MSNKNRNLLVVGTIVVGIIIWYVLDKAKKQPNPAPLPPVPPISPVPPAPVPIASDTYKVGDRVTFEFVVPDENHPECKKKIIYSGNVCGRNPDGKYNVLWDAYNRIAIEDSACPNHIGTRNVLRVQSPDAEATFGTCGKSPLSPEVAKYLPDSFSTEQLKELQMPSTVTRTITVENKPELCVGSKPTTLKLQGYLCNAGSNKVNWMQYTNLSGPTEEYQDIDTQIKCINSSFRNLNSDFTNHFGDCTKGSVLLDSSILPYDNEAKDLYPDYEKFIANRKPLQPPMKIGDRVTYDVPNAHQKNDCKYNGQYSGTICDRNQDGTFNVLWDSAQLKADPNTVKFDDKGNANCELNIGAYREFLLDPVPTFGSCGQSDEKKNLPDRFTRRQLDRIPPDPPVTGKYKLGDRVTYDIVYNDFQPKCNVTLRYLGKICGQNADGKYKVVWFGISQIPSDPKACTMMKSSTFFRIGQRADDATEIFGTCGIQPKHQQVREFIPDSFAPEELQPLILPDKVNRIIKVNNQPNMCVGAKEKHVLLHGVRCPNDKKVEWQNWDNTLSGISAEYSDPQSQKNCNKWMHKNGNPANFVSLFGDCTNGSLLLSPTILPYENKEEDLYPIY